MRDIGTLLARYHSIQVNLQAERMKPDSDRDIETEFQLWFQLEDIKKETIKKES
ncbi:MAG: hypothetical protein ACUZ8H_14040 [Candidatus Anammoxibacter sp.]